MMQNDKKYNKKNKYRSVVSPFIIGNAEDSNSRPFLFLLHAVRLEN